MNKFLFLLFSGLVLTSCNSDVDAGEFVVGSDYLEVTNKVISIDTMTVDVSNVKLDSLVTSSQSRILVGNYDDPFFGKVRSESYFQCSTSIFNLYSENSDTEATGYVFDSIAMILKYDDYYYADTTKLQTLSIHRVLKKLKANSDDGNFYNSSSFKYDANSLGMISFYPKPIGRDSINIKLNAVFGAEIFNKFKNNEITTYDEFTNYFKGFMLKSTSTESNSIIGYGLSSVLRLYYSKGKGDSETSYFKDFTISDISKQFNNILSDKTGTFLEDLPLSKKSFSSIFTGNKGFVQAGTGLVCRIDFPNVKQLKYLTENGAIVDAKLFIKPVKNSYSKLFPLPEKLNVYVVDNLNRTQSQLSDASGNILTANLNASNDEFDENIGYEINISGFLQKEMKKNSDFKYGLILTLPISAKNVDRVVLGDQLVKENKIELKIYYITY
ncbi:DUF4270 domain-containing protein [Flavobacterium sp. N3904]|uniref:DUF4270 domain-containing protein n=1 Tax=Flavobacterium sp. N3904 TaxID=2986835 RepID=UPI002224C30F|nr:DUF4270 domain-containing protein [Flavobacterium sp. N3904]